MDSVPLFLALSRRDWRPTLDCSRVREEVEEGVEGVPGVPGVDILIFVLVASATVSLLLFTDQ